MNGFPDDPVMLTNPTPISSKASDDGSGTSTGSDVSRITVPEAEVMGLGV